MIKSFRRSLKGDNRRSNSSNKSSGTNSGSPVISDPASVRSLATTPPKKIIKALYNYAAQGPGELSFSKGDFLYVIGHENDESWFEAYDPPSGLQGMVPVSYFDIITRKETIPTVPISQIMSGSQRHSVSENGIEPKVKHTQSMVSLGSSSQVRQHRHISSSSASRPSPLYGVVQYDFTAERPDELQANAGESIIVIAQSNDEWFVAKPIGRLGGPGLIPVSYVELREIGSNSPVLDVRAAVKRAGVPKVEEWKRMAAEYKASSITLGKFEDDTAAISRQMNDMDLKERESLLQLRQGLTQRTSSSITSPAGGSYAEPPRPVDGKSAGSSSYGTNSLLSSPGSAYVLRASVDRYAFHNGRYWYLLTCEMSNGRYRNLCRYYQDFYDFQIKLLDDYPEEAGRTGRQRILPFMPGPLTYVNDSISSQRRVNLDEYVRKLVELPPYISRHSTVLQLFAVRPGDIESQSRSSAMPQPLEGAISAGTSTVSLSNRSESVSPDTSRIREEPPEADDDVHTPATTQENLETTAQPVQTSLKHHSRVESQSTVTKNANIAPIAPGPASKRPGDNASSTVKIKIFHEDDLIAIKFSLDAGFESLERKICERLNLNRILLYYVDSAGQKQELSNDEDFIEALAGKNKLVLYADASQ